MADTTYNAVLDDIMQSSTDWQDNRFADAYVEPKLVASNGTSTLTGEHHTQSVPTVGPDHDAGNAALYWTAYMTSAFDPSTAMDCDGLEDISEGLGLTKGNAYSYVYFEVTRSNLEYYGIDMAGNYEAYLKLVAMHEIGHQFGLADESAGSSIYNDDKFFDLHNLGINTFRLNAAELEHIRSSLGTRNLADRAP